MSATQLITLCDKTDDFDEIVTQQWLKDKNLSFQNSPFSAISAHDRMLIDNTNGGFSLFNNAWVRWTTVHVKNGVKLLCFSDDDYFNENDKTTLKRFENNLAKSTEAFGRLSQCFGVEMKNSVEGNKYFIDVYVPISEFDWVQSQMEFDLFLKKCQFNSREDIEKVKLEIIASR